LVRVTVEAQDAGRGAVPQRAVRDASACQAHGFQRVEPRVAQDGAHSFVRKGDEPERVCREWASLPRPAKEAMRIFLKLGVECRRCGRSGHRSPGAIVADPPVIAESAVIVSS
jgi:hypothetical protein